MTTINDYKFDVSQFIAVPTSHLKLTSVMSMDENGALYVASEDHVIYRLFPWANTFQLFAGTPGGLADASKARDGPRLGNDESSPIVGPVRSIDALGTPGSVFVIDQGRKSLLRISTAEDGKVRTIRRDLPTVTTKTSKDGVKAACFVASFPHEDKLTLINGSQVSTDNQTWAVAPHLAPFGNFKHPLLTTFNIGIGVSSYGLASSPYGPASSSSSASVLASSVLASSSASSAPLLSASAYLSRSSAPSLLSSCPLWYQGAESTFSVSFSAGKRLWLSTLHPLATLAPDITICVTTGSPKKPSYVACLGVAQFSKSEGLDEVAGTLFNHDAGLLQGDDWNGPDSYSMFLFSPTSNMLYAWNDTTKVLIRYYNVISSFTLERLNLKESLFSMASKVDLDMSPLRPTLMSHDIVITNTHSGDSWSLHQDILAQRMPITAQSMEKFQTLLQSARIPSNAISAFLDYLYFKPLVAETEGIKFISELCYTVFLCEALDIKNSSGVAAVLEAQIDAHLSPTAACDLLFDFWFDPGVILSASSPVINLLARKAAELEHSAILAQLKTRKNLAIDGVRALELAFSVLAVGTWRLERTHQALELTLPDPSPRIVTDPKPLLETQTDFAFGTNDQWTVAKGWLLYRRWSWFKYLIESGMEESKTRLITMPSWVTANIMRAIIKTVYQQNTELVPLSEEELTLMLERGVEIGLIDSSKTVISPFETLIGRCRGMLMTTTTQSNCLRLLTLYHRLQLDAELRRTLRFINSIKDSISLCDLEP